MEPFEKDVSITVWDSRGNSRKVSGTIWGYHDGLQIAVSNFTVQVDWSSVAQAMAHTANRASDDE